MQKIPKKKILNHHNEVGKCVMFSSQYKHETFLSARISAYQSESNVTDLRSQNGDSGFMARAEAASGY